MSSPALARNKVAPSPVVRTECLAEAFLAHTADLNHEKDREAVSQLREARRLRTALRELEKSTVGEAVRRHVRLKGEPLDVTDIEGEVESHVRDMLGPEFDKIFKHLYKLILTEKGLEIHTTVRSSYVGGDFFTTDFSRIEKKERVPLNKEGKIIEESGMVKRALTKLRLGATDKVIPLSPLRALMQAGMTLAMVEKFFSDTLAEASKAHGVTPPPWTPRLKSD